MRATFRPSTMLGSRRLPGLDEDEATLAVAAARALFKERNIAPSSVRRLECLSTTGQGWSFHGQIALGLRHATVSDAMGEEQEGTLRITSNAPRFGSPHFGAIEAMAVAEFPGTGKDIDASERMTRTIDDSKATKMSAWETKAPTGVPMGAYIPKATWDASLDARYRLVASYCTTDRRGHHPPLDPCPICGGPTETRELSTTGTLYTHTIIAAGGGPTEFDPFQDTDGTYGVGIVDFGDAIRVAGLLTETDLASLSIGQKMEAVFRRIYAQEGAWRYGTKFRVAKQA
ncbi:MAG TPA: OB-fold domain-containing protein [Candidatus Thermoplasmatota archaeon]